MKSRISALNGSANRTRLYQMNYRTGEDDPGSAGARNRRVEFKVIPDKPQDAPEFESTGEVVTKVKTGPGFNSGVLAGSENIN